MKTTNNGALNDYWGQIALRVYRYRFIARVGGEKQQRFEWVDVVCRPSPAEHIFIFHNRKQCGMRKRRSFIDVFETDLFVQLGCATRVKCNTIGDIPQHFVGRHMVWHTMKQTPKHSCALCNDNWFGCSDADPNSFLHFSIILFAIRCHFPASLQSLNSHMVLKRARRKQLFPKFESKISYKKKFATKITISRSDRKTNENWVFDAKILRQSEKQNWETTE